MALSEREQKVLEQIERDLAAPERKLTEMLPRGRARSAYRRFAILGAVAGITLVLAGLFSKIIIVSVLGFLVLVAGVAAMTTVYGGRLPWRPGAAAGKRASPRRIDGR